MTEPTLDNLKNAINQTLGSQRVCSVDSDVLLLQTGTVTSIEIIEVFSELEKAFHCVIPDSTTNPSTLSLNRLLAAIGGSPTQSTSQTLIRDSRLALSLKRCFHRPILFLGLVLILFFGLNALVHALIQGPLQKDYLSFLEQGQRFHPFAGVFSNEDFAFSFKFHELNHATQNVGRSIIFLGDSGTFGSFLPASLSLPGQLHRRMGEFNDDHVYNLSWYGQSFLKDAMILELAWDKRIDTVIFSLADAYFHRLSQDTWISDFSHIAFNRPLFDSYALRIPTQDQAPFQSMQTQLKAADLKNLGPLKRVIDSKIFLTRYAPYFQSKWYNGLAPNFIGSDMKTQKTLLRDHRFAVNAGPFSLDIFLHPNDYDKRPVKMLESTAALLNRRGIKTVFFLEPRGPLEWRSLNSESPVREIVANLAARTNSTFIDASWILNAEHFLDKSTHYTAEGNRLIANLIANHLESTAPNRKQLP